MPRRPKYRNPYIHHSEKEVIYYPLKEYYINHNPDIDYNYIAFNPVQETLFMPKLTTPATTSGSLMRGAVPKTIKVTRTEDGFNVFFPNDANTGKEHSILELYSTYCVIRTGTDKIWRGEFDETINAIFWVLAFDAASRPIPSESVIYRDFSIENLVALDLLVDADVQAVATFAKLTSDKHKTTTLSSEYCFDNVVYGNKRGRYKVLNRKALDTIDQYISGDRYVAGRLERVIIEEFNQKDEEGNPIKDMWYLDNQLRVTARGRLYVRIFDESLLTKLNKTNCMTSGFAHNWGLKARNLLFKEITSMSKKSAMRLVESRLG